MAKCFSSTDEAVAFLKGSLVFAMSLGSRELFHSNVWKWLFEHDSQFASKIFFDDLASKKISVFREQDHRDISIWTDKGDKKREKIYIIENKFKSLPRRTQLEEYQGKVVGAKKNSCRFGGGVITGIVKPNWELPNWRFVSYTEIANGIENVLGDENIKFSSDAERDSVVEYVKVVRALVCVIEKFQSRIGERWAVLTDCQSETSVGVGDICLKLNADKFLNYLSGMKEFGEQRKSSIPGWRLEMKSDFTNCSSLVDVAYVRDDFGGDKITEKIGIQIQDNYYRIFLQGSGASNQIFQKAVDLGLLDPEWENMHIKRNRRDSRYKQFNLHGVGCFVYQDETLEKREFAVLGDKLKADIKRIAEMLPHLS